jgi:hypothetical protein
MMRDTIVEAHAFALLMRRVMRPVLLVAAALTQPLITAAHAQETALDAVPTHDTLTLTSQALGEARRVNVHLPRKYTASADGTGTRRDRQRHRATRRRLGGISPLPAR